MAIYHLSVQVISRGQGRSCVAAAAYRAGEKLEDERQGLTHDYSRRHDVRDTFILAPDSAPAWVQDRQALWSAVDAAEKRKDARTAREVNLALPRELTPEQQREAVQEFVQAAFVSRGMVADVAIHEGHNDQEPNPHAHILLTTRTITPEGFGGKDRDWNAKELLVNWRTQWEVTCNAALEDAQQSARIDARSLAAQKIHRLPTVHEGPAVRQMERRGIATDRGNLNRAIQAHQTAVVDLAEVRQARLTLRSLQQQLDQAEAWREQAGWPEQARQRLRGWEEQAGRVLTREDVTQWVQEAQAELVRVKATEQGALRAMQVSDPLQTTHHQLTEAVQEGQRAQEQLQHEFSGIRGLWKRWRAPQAYQAQQARVEQGTWAEGQLEALQEPWAQHQKQVAQNRAAYEQAQTERQAVETKLARWQPLLDQPWTVEEQTTKPAIHRQVPPQPLQEIRIRIIDSDGNDVSLQPPIPPKLPSRERDDQDRGYSR